MTTTDMEPLQALFDLTKYVQDNTRQTHELGGDIVDVHFFRVRFTEGFSKEYFTHLFNRWLESGKGEFAPVQIERLKAGPSYIEWGTWIGDQGLAMKVMAAGEHVGLWRVITPKTMHVEGKEADDLAGLGFVMTSGFQSAGTTEGDS